MRPQDQAAVRQLLMGQPPDTADTGMGDAMSGGMIAPGAPPGPSVGDVANLPLNANMAHFQPPQGVLPPPSRAPGGLKKLLLNFTYNLGENLSKSMGMESYGDIQQKDMQNAITLHKAMDEHKMQQAQIANLAEDNRRLNQQEQDRQAEKIREFNATKTTNQTIADFLTNNPNLDPNVRAAILINRKVPEEIFKKDTSTTEWESYLQAAGGDPIKALKLQQANKIATAQASRPPKDTSAAEAAKLTSSYQYHNTAIDKLQQPIDQFNTRLDRLRTTLDQKNMTADALATPELLTVMAGGTGSGVRLNEAEIARVVGGRTVWENLKAQVQKWSLNPQQAVSITDAQRSQMKALIAEVTKQMGQKSSRLDAARERIANSDSPVEHRQIYSKLRSELSTDVTGTGAAAGAVDGTYDPRTKTIIWKNK